MKILFKLFCVIFFALPGANASEIREREVLLQIVETLDVVTAAIVDARRQSSEVKSSPDEYIKLISDVREVSQALRRHVVEPAFKPLRPESLFLAYTLAPNELEAESLLQAIRALSVASMLAKEAEKEASYDARYFIQYEKLLWDISSISFAIQKVIDRPTRNSRTPAELYSEFVQ